MAQVITRLKLESAEYDSKIKRATQGLLQMERECRKVDGTLAILESDQKKFVSSLGSMQTVATSVRGKLNELTQAYTDLSVQYKRLTDEEKKGDFGKALSASLDQLKTRIHDTKRSLNEVSESLNGSSNRSGMSGKFGGMMAVFGGNMLTKAVTAATSALSSFTSKLSESVSEGIRLAEAGDGIRHAFGQIGSEGLLQGLRDATHGTVTDIELMKAAVQANDFRIPLEQLGKYLEFANLKASQTGQSVEYLTQSIVTGLGRQSVMILDNLGLSAAEIRDNMKDGASMAEAVGKIIDKQISSVGSHYETAAERATKKTVELQNAQAAVGEQLIPLKESWTSFLNSVEIDCLKVIAKLGEMFSEAQRIKNLQNDMFGGAGGSLADRQFDAFKRLKTRSAQENDIRGLTDQYNRRINALGGQRESIKQQIAAERAKGASVHDTAYLSQQLRSINDNIKATRAERDSFLSRANQWMNRPPATTKPDASGGGTTRNGSGGGTTTVPKVEAPLPVGSIAALNKELSELRKQQEMAASPEEWEEWENRIYGITAKLKILKGELPNFNKIQQTTGPSVLGIGVGQESIDDMEKQLKAMLPEGKMRVPAKLELDPKTTANISVQGKETADSWQHAASAIQSVGGALQGIEDPAAKVVGIIGQAIATIALSFAQATGKDAKGGTWAWIAAVAGGLATMISTISAIKSATAGYAEGGIVKGTRYSGDNIDGGSIGVNAGELVLNKAQQGNLASQLAESDRGRGYQPSHISGEQIYIAVNRYLKRSGKGEIVTWR